MMSRVASIFPVLLLAGCDPFYGAESSTSFAGPVDVQCIGTVLASLPEAARVTYQRSEDHSTEILPKQRNVTTVMHVWAYGEGGMDVLQVNQTPDGWDFRNARSRMGVAVPHEEMERFVPLMRKINRAIQTRCGLPVASLPAKPVGDTNAQEL